jgi:hypothetical protein
MAEPDGDESAGAAIWAQAERTSTEEAVRANPEESKSRREMTGMEFPRGSHGAVTTVRNVWGTTRESKRFQGIRRWTISTARPVPDAPSSYGRFK